MALGLDLAIKLLDLPLKLYGPDGLLWALRSLGVDVLLPGYVELVGELVLQRLVADVVEEVPVDLLGDRGLFSDLVGNLGPRLALHVRASASFPLPEELGLNRRAHVPYCLQVLGACRSFESVVVGGEVHGALGRRPVGRHLLQFLL